MFKKPQIDVKKALQKFLDVKRDSFNRLRHLRGLLGMDVTFVSVIFVFTFSSTTFFISQTPL